MSETVGVRELRQNLSRYLARLRDGEAFVVTDRGREVGRLVPSGPAADQYTKLAQDLGASVPVSRLEEIAARLDDPGAPAGTTDAYLDETRGERR